jgi:APA family basic amino acid/polyamine antiporter
VLKRSLGLVHATALVVGIIVGASIFVQPSAIAASVPDIRAVSLVWIAAGVLTLFGALIAAELSTAFPKAGGVYVFLSEAFSPGVAYLWGWAMFWTMHTGIIAAIATVFARYVGFFVDVGDTGLRLIAIAAIVGLSAINYLGVKQGGVVQTTLTFVKIAAVVGITAIAFLLGPSVPIEAAAIPPSRPPALPHSYVAAIVAGLFAYGGWHMVTYAAEETVDPERTLPRALIIGVLIVTACYLALNAAYFHVLPHDQIGKSTRVAADAAAAVVGSGGAAVVSLVVALSALGAVNGVILAGPRVYLAMARDRVAPAWLGAIHETHRTPHRAIVVQAIWASVLASTWNYSALVMQVVYTEWIFFALMAAGLIVLRRRPGYSPRFRVPFHPVIPVLFILASLYIVIDQIVATPRNAIVGLLLVLVGWPIYLFTLSKSRTQ